MTETNHLRLKRKGFKQMFFSSVKAKHKRGVAILIAGILGYENIYDISYNEVRFVRIIGKIEGSEITTLNVYAPPGSDWIFYRKHFQFNVRLRAQLYGVGWGGGSLILNSFQI